MNQEEIRELLVRSFDEALPPEEQKTLDAALADSDEWRREKQKLEQMRRLFAGLQASHSPSFVDKVMERHRRLPLESAFVALLPRVAAAGLLLLVAALIGLYLMEGSISTEAIIGTAGLAPEDAYTYLQY